MNPLATVDNTHLSSKRGILFGLAAIVLFHVAFTIPEAAWLVVGFLVCFLQLANLRSARQVFYLGMFVGFCIYAPQLSFFWKIFRGAAIPLWLILAFWPALFLLLVRLARQNLSPLRVALLTPFLWMALEYFRSELYYLRFSWLSIGYFFSSLKHGPFFGAFGIYGIGFLVAAIAVLVSQRSRRVMFAGVFCWSLVVATTFVPNFPEPYSPGENVRIAGIQLEFKDDDILTALERTRERFPKTDIYVLSEYAFSDQPTKFFRQWCRDHKTYLVAGGRDPLPDGNQFYNTAFVIGPDGEFVFKQVKSVPIQFFKDGLPAPKQELWNSPWGKIGICICYDLSYRRVVDNLVSLGAQLLIVPTMDVMDWGEYQHKLHGRVAPMRASEYGIPVFRLCSSGISQAVWAEGNVTASAPFPGEGEILQQLMPLRKPGRLPIDRWLAPLSVAVTAGFILWLAIVKWLFKRTHQQKT